MQKARDAAEEGLEENKEDGVDMADSAGAVIGVPLNQGINYQKVSASFEKMLVRVFIFCLIFCRKLKTSLRKTWFSSERQFI